MTRPSDATRSVGSDSSPAPQVSTPGSRQPLPSTARPVGPFRPQGPRFAPLPPPRRLSPAQGSRLGLIAAVIVLLGAAIGVAVAFVLPTQYAARTVLDYTVSKDNASDLLRTDRDLTTQVVLLGSRSVLGPVADANGITADALTSKVTVTNVVNSDLLQVDVRDPSRDVGVALADAIAKRYLDVVNSTGAKGYLQTELDSAKRDLSTTPTGLVGTPAGQARLDAQTRVDTLQTQLDTVNLTGNRATLAVPAYSMTAPAFPNPALAAGTGTLVGLVVAALAAIWLSRRWTRS